MHRSALSLLMLSPVFVACACVAAPADARVEDSVDADPPPPDTSDADIPRDGVSPVTDGARPSDAARAEDAFESRDVAGGRSRDLTVRILSTEPSAHRLVEARLIDEFDATRALVVLRGFNRIEALTVRGALLDRPARLEWFVDVDDDLLYRADTVDESRWIAVDPGPGPQTVELSAAASRRSLLPSTGAALTLFGRFTEFEPHVGVFFQLELESQDRTVALYRYRALPAQGRFEFALRGALRAGQVYTARWFIDLNDNDTYDPRGDHGGTLSFEAAARDVTLAHEHHANRAWIE
jgi:hypothetical protein